jgi:hypoxanthine-guanine phosphoribosyltransferase
MLSMLNFKGDFMRLFIVLFLLVFTFIGCSNYTKEFTITGEITRIEENMVSIDNRVIIVDDISKLKQGQNVQVTLIDHTAEDDWDPKDFKVKKIEIIK